MNKYLLGATGLAILVVLYKFTPVLGLLLNVLISLNRVGV